MLTGIDSAISGLVARVRSLWRGLRRRADFEAEMSEEFRQHLELRTEDLIRRGLTPEEAARRARIEFGHIDSHKEDARASRGLRFFDEIRFSWLDVKLGLRMIGKYPGLSLVSVIGMSVAIALGVGGFGFIRALVDAPLPLDEGERVVSLQNTDVRTPGSPKRRALHDFLLWREELATVRDLSAFADDDRHLVIQRGESGVVRVALMTASGFRVARVAPFLGRPLLDDDEEAGAAPVLVIAYEEWEHRFGGDPDIVGRPVRLDTTVHTVVGVMPEGFRFPVNHRYWVPLRLDPATNEVGGGPPIFVFGRLAGGATLDRAQAELATIGRRMAAAYPGTHEHLRPTIYPYTQPFAGVESPARVWLVRAVQLLLSLLLVAVAVNVAVLIYARTATRTGEIAVRSALGASRRRVVAQLFAEALVLSLVAAVVGLATVELAFDRLLALAGSSADRLPFWVEFGLSPALVIYAAGLAVLAALIVGIIPALKVTGSGLQGALQQLSSRGSQMRLGPTWTALIVTQVAVAVALLPYALYTTGRFVTSGFDAPDYPVDEFLRASLAIDSDAAPVSADTAAYRAATATRFASSATELVGRLEAQREVAGVAYASWFPGSEPHTLFEVEGTGTREWVWVNQVSSGLFTVFDVPIVAGRGLVESDAARNSNTVIVDQVFAERVLGGGQVLGRRIRELVRRQDGTGEMDGGPWLEIVGVVPEFTAPPAFEPEVPKLYRPLALADAPGAVQLAVRMKRRADPMTFARRLREITAIVDSHLRFVELETASQVERRRRQGLLNLALAIVAVTGSVLLLSAAGIYAMMSFTVANRRREIGIRAALGSSRRRLLGAVLARASAQLGAGVLGGLILAEAFSRVMGGGSLFFQSWAPLLLPSVAGLVLTIGLVAALGPARRGLAVQPTEALREE